MGAVLALLVATAAATLAVLAAARGRWAVTVTGVACSTMAVYAAARLYLGVVLR